MVKIIPVGDIFKVEGVTSYAHGCNCLGSMGKGIATQFKSKFPAMYRTYRQICQRGKYRPGDVYDYDYGGGHVYNLATQVGVGRCANLDYIEEAVRNMCELAVADGVEAIALPAIGAGIGGLKWKDVKNVITEVADNYPEVTLYLVEKYKA